MLSEKEIAAALRKMIKENSGENLDEAMADFGADKSMKELDYAVKIFDDLYVEVTGKKVEELGDDDDFDYEKYIDGLSDGQVADKFDFSTCRRCGKGVEKVTKHTEVIGKREYKQLVCDTCLKKIKSLALNPETEIIECEWCCPEWKKASREPGVKGVEATHKLIINKKGDGKICAISVGLEQSLKKNLKKKKREEYYITKNEIAM